MIEGLKFQMKSVDLVKHLTSRVEYHSTRGGVFYKKEVSNFKENAADSQFKMGQNTIVKTVDELEKQEAFHRMSARYFKVICDGVIPDDTYIMTKEDLAHIEYVEMPVRHWY